ncbi:uncharacterized protein [Dermacentor albipictus]|uniref:uncharacterized protein n=1 Tax=Dermacentor albipictus TaxID=60249 RepID=UPI0038FC5757
MAEIKRMMTVQLQQQQAQPLSPQPQQMAMTEDEPEVAVNPRTENAASAGPAPKRRAIENLKERRLSDRVDNLEDRLTHFEEYIRMTFTNTITDRFIAIEQTCQQLTTTVSRLNMGKRTYAYIKDFLTERTTEIIARDQRLQKKKLGSVGTPQGSVISPLLFNLVMIGVAERLSRVARVRHTIYADDLTLWDPGGSDGHIENTLQEAVDAIEEQLDGSGLICSPSKSELLVIALKRAARKTKGNEPAREQDTIKIKMSGGHMIPVVETIRVLGMLIERKRVNGETVNRVVAKVTTAIRLIKRRRAASTLRQRGVHGAAKRSLLLLCLEKYDTSNALVACSSRVSDTCRQSRRRCEYVELGSRV